ncbi:MAG: TIM barrel protein [Phycisphaerales bacterium]|nr:TIM barrel protein [Phycisphaerales bacterium]
MLLTLNLSALRSRLTGQAGQPKLKLTDAPALARNELGVNGLVISTDLLVGADRQALQRLLEAADKAGCPCLVLMEVNPQPLGSPDILPVEAATERCLRVAQAAHWLGCSAFSIPIEAPDDEETLANVAANLKPISRRAEKLDLNLCLAPRPGLTASPDRLTEVLKKIGGFRVGTLPDFAAAAASPDPVQYLRRLVPYASAVLVPAMNEQEAEAASASAASTKSKAKKSPEPVESSDEPPAKPAKGKASKSKKAKPAEAEIAEAEAADPQTPAPVASPASKPGSYDLTTYAGVLEAVGYEGPIALDFRGSGDPIPALTRTRDILMKSLAAPAAAEETGLSALLAAVQSADDETDELADEEEAGADDE